MSMESLRWAMALSREGEASDLPVQFSRIVYLAVCQQRSVIIMMSIFSPRKARTPLVSALKGSHNIVLRILKIYAFSLIVATSGCGPLNSERMELPKKTTNESGSIDFLKSLKIFEEHAAWRDARFIHNIFGDGIIFSKLPSDSSKVESYIWIKKNENDNIIYGDAYIHAKGQFEYSFMRISINGTNLCITSSDLRTVFGKQVLPRQVPVVHFHAGPGFVRETDVINEYHASGHLQIYAAFMYKKCATGLSLSLGENAMVFGY